MKAQSIVCFIGLLLSLNLCHAVPMTSLQVLTDPIQVGDNFSVEVQIDNDVVGEELLAFGFNVGAIDPLLNFDGFNVNSLFSDESDPFNSQNIAGLAFPGITDRSVLLATLEFSALSAGTASIEVQGLFDGSFDGLYYTINGLDISSGFNISAQTQVTILDRQVNIPVPGTLALSAVAFFTLLQRRLHL